MELITNDAIDEEGRLGLTNFNPINFEKMIGDVGVRSICTLDIHKIHTMLLC